MNVFFQVIQYTLHLTFLLHSKANTEGALLKKILLKILQMSQENTYVGACF